MNRRLHVTVLMLDGSYASPAFAPVDVFHAAGRLWNQLHLQAEQPCFDVQVASLRGSTVASLSGPGVVPHVSLDAVTRTDLALVPTVALATHRLEPALVEWLQAQHRRGAHLAGICTGAAYLAEAGLLDGRVATTHWAVADLMRQRYPAVHWHPDRLITEDGRLFCCGGVYSSMDLSLFLVERFAGREVAIQCAKALLLPPPRKLQTPYMGPLLSQPHGDEQVRLAERYIQEHFHANLSVERLADQAGMGLRNFIRRFKAATGMLPSAYLQAVRMRAAKGMLETGGAPVQTVCSRVGYQDLAHFRELFRRHTGMTPQQYRERFAPAEAFQA
jgi:transcriptional regulator GlxA family with amidase domain